MLQLGGIGYLIAGIILIADAGAYRAKDGKIDFLYHRSKSGCYVNVKKP